MPYESETLHDLIEVPRNIEQKLGGVVATFTGSALRKLYSACPLRSKKSATTWSTSIQPKRGDEHISTHTFTQSSMIKCVLSMYSSARLHAN